MTTMEGDEKEKLPPMEARGRGQDPPVRRTLRFQEEGFSPERRKKTRERLPVLQRKISLLAYEPIVPTFVKNGDPFFEGVKINITQRSVRTWESLLSELSRRIDLPAGVRQVYTPEGGHRLQSLSQLEHKKMYVCGSMEPFRQMSYSTVKNPTWKVSKSKISETEMPSLFSSTSYPLSPVDPSVSFSDSMRSSKNLDASARNWMESSIGNSGRSARKLSQKLRTMRVVSVTEPPEETVRSSDYLGQSHKSISGMSIIKPLSLTIYRNGPPPRDCVTVYMNRDTIKSWEDAKQLFSENLGSINGILHIYKLDGEEVESLSQLWMAGTQLIAAGKEKFHISDFLAGSQARSETNRADSENQRSGNQASELPAIIPLPPVTSTKLPMAILPAFHKEAPLKQPSALSAIPETSSSVMDDESARTSPEPEDRPEQPLDLSGSHNESSELESEEKSRQTEQDEEERNQQIEQVEKEMSEDVARGNEKSVGDSDKLVNASNSTENGTSFEENSEKMDVTKEAPNYNDGYRDRGLHEQLSTEKLSDDEQQESESSSSSSDSVKQYFASLHFPPSSSNDMTPVVSSTNLPQMKKQRRKSLLQELQISNLLRPTSISSSLRTSPSIQSICAHRGSFPSMPYIHPQTPSSDISLGIPQSVVDMLLPAREDEHSYCSSDSIVEPRFRNVAIQTNFVDNHLSTIVELDKPTEANYSMEGLRAKRVHFQSGIDFNSSSAAAQLHKETKDKYSVGIAIEEGQFAAVKVCTSKLEDKKEYLLRVIQKGKVFGMDDRVLQEIRVMKMMRHENVMIIIDYWETPEEYCMVMEPIEGGDLYDAILHCQHFNEADTKTAINQLGLALVYLHAHRIVHRNIKPENIFLSLDSSRVWSVKLAGFSLAMVATEPLTLLCGNEYYRAPEMISRKGYGAKADVWSSGVIAYILLSGIMPFGRRKKSGVFTKLSFPKCYWEQVSSEAKSVVQWLLQASPCERYSSSQLLQHPWFKTPTPKSSKPSKIIDYLTAKAATKVAPVPSLIETALDPLHVTK